MKRIILGVCITITLVGQVWASEVSDRARSDYQYQLDTYRDVYNQFVLKRSEFEKNDSFANQEELVIAAKDMLVRRARVWSTYFQVLKVDLYETEGMNEEIKAVLVGRLDEKKIELSEHEATVNELNSRSSMLTEAIKLNEEVENFEDLSYEVLFEISMTNFDWALIQMEEFTKRLDAEVEVQFRDSNERAFRLRGLDEVASIIDRLQERYEELEIDLRKESRTTSYDKRYEEMRDEFSNMYTDLLRANSLIGEISEGMVL